MKIQISSSILNFSLLSNLWNPIFALACFVGIFITSSSISHSGINKVIHVSLLIINHPYFKDRIKTMKTFYRRKPLEKLARPNNLTNTGSQKHLICRPRFQSLIHIELLPVHSFYLLKPALKRLRLF